MEKENLDIKQQRGEGTFQALGIWRITVNRLSNLEHLIGEAGAKFAWTNKQDKTGKKSDLERNKIGISLGIKVIGLDIFYTLYIRSRCLWD